MRRSTILWFLVAACLGVALFLVKYEVQSREEQLAELHRDILENQEALHVLEAEWSYLNRPDRLESLVRRHLDLVPMDKRRVGQLEQLPMRLPMPVPGPDTDPMVTIEAIALAPRPSIAALSTPPLPVGRPLWLPIRVIKRVTE